ncbi:MAG: hypothetical protein NTW04_03820, partial [Elusimicrobia bacterium]|nr:hypothetical protein [Elusimicrobiota bacterium]
GIGLFKMEDLPRIGLNYSFNRINYDLLTRKDKQDIYSATLGYDVLSKPFFVPKRVDAGYTYSASGVSYQSERMLRTSGIYNSDESAKDYNIKLGFVPIKDWSFNPSYSLKTVGEKRADFSSGLPINREYPKAMEQAAGFSGNTKLLKWLNPNFNYSISTYENNNITPTTVTVANTNRFYDIGEIKTINRAANGGATLALNAGEIFPKTKLFKYLAVVSGYNIADGDTWQNVEKGLDVKGDLWVRKPITPSSDMAIRTALTLRDTISSSQRWQPFSEYDFKGRLDALETLNLSNNYIKSVQKSEITGTPSKTISTTVPDILASVARLETLLKTGRWFSAASANVKYTDRVNETVLISRENEKVYGTDLRFTLLKFMETSLSYNIKNIQNYDLRVDRLASTLDHKDYTIQGGFDLKKFRITPKYDYVFEEAINRNMLGKEVISHQTTVMTPSILIRSDFNLPGGIKLPFLSKPLMFTNRIVWTTTASYAIKRSPIIAADNSRTLTLGTNADYEISRNMRLSINGSLQRLWHQYIPQEEYISYQAGSTLTLQF